MKIGNREIKFGDLFGGDRTLWIILIVLCVSSVLVIYSSAASIAYRKYDGDTSIYLIRQIKYVGIGLLFAWIVHRIDYKYYFRFASWFFGLAIALMIFTFFAQGTEINDAKRWLPVMGVTFQPADCLKITLVMMIARALSLRQRFIDRISILPSLSPFDYSGKSRERNLNILVNTTIPILMPIVIALLLVMVNSLSTALIVAGSSLVIFIIGRVRFKELVRLVFFGLIVLVVAFLFMKAIGVGRTATWESRISSFFTTEEGVKSTLELDDDEFQKHQAQIAVASGWLGGKGPGNSTQRSNLPHPYSDYAYAFVIEEYGVLGAIFLLGCYLWIFFRGVVIFRRCETPFPSLLVLGLSLMITLQAFIHMFVSVGLAPVTGQTLPIISLGGSSLVFTCISFGIILGVSRIENGRIRSIAVERRRHLELEEWEHIEVNDEPAESERGSKSEKRKYYGGVLWTEDKSNS